MGIHWSFIMYETLSLSKVVHTARTDSHIAWTKNRDHLKQKNRSDIVLKGYCIKHVKRLVSFGT